MPLRSKIEVGAPKSVQLMISRSKFLVPTPSEPSQVLERFFESESRKVKICAAAAPIITSTSACFALSENSIPTAVESRETSRPRLDSRLASVLHGHESIVYYDQTQSYCIYSTLQLTETKLKSYSAFTLPLRLGEYRLVRGRQRRTRRVSHFTVTRW